MGEERMVNEKVCPKCGKTYRGHPAISRVDNVTPICPLCGTREALESLGISDEEKEKIIASIPIVEDK
jgi:RNA polymerase subunit RPABC4/transcription elongation factor Spt4